MDPIYHQPIENSRNDQKFALIVNSYLFPGFLKYKDCMETYLSLDENSKQLCLFAKKRFEHSSDVCLKVNGVLNTVTANVQMDSTLTKVRHNIS